MFASQPGNRPLEVFVAEHLNDLEHTFAEVEVDVVVRHDFGALKGILIEYTFKAPSATDSTTTYQQGQFMFELKGYIYTATYSDEYDGFAAATRADARRLISSIEVEADEPVGWSALSKGRGRVRPVAHVSQATSTRASDPATWMRPPGYSSPPTWWSSRAV